MGRKRLNDGIISLMVKCLVAGNWARKSGEHEKRTVKKGSKAKFASWVGVHLAIDVGYFADIAKPWRRKYTPKSYLESGVLRKK